MHIKRLHVLKEAEKKDGPVAYWMSRDQRVKDNWALIYAQGCAINMQKPLVVLFCLVPSFLGATARQYEFMKKGLQGVEKRLKHFNIPFYLLEGYPEKIIPGFLKRFGVQMLITDFDPLRIKTTWKMGVADIINIPFYEIDAHNIIPCRIVSDKQEYGAYTIRPKIKRLLNEFLDEFPVLERHPFSWQQSVSDIAWEEIFGKLDIERTVKGVDWITPGEDAAHETLERFLTENIHRYKESRNDPNKYVLSNISPYLHFGHISAQRIVFEIRKRGLDGDASAGAFMEELIVRKELSDNYCLYNRAYDTIKGLPDWARKTLDAHRSDKREFVYPVDDLEHGHTHDRLWNAAQMEMVIRGKMHGYMRMYWAKKILEWTESPEDAFEIAIYLNDKYELDGRDPNGYAGIAWSIGGLHDRAWNERKVFGKIRYMSYNGCKAKFSIDGYIERISKLTA